MPRPYLDAETPIAFAHRGGAKLWPENTLLAFQNAITLGYRYIETDVHLTRDGRIVICHDATVERMTESRARVCDLSFEEIRRLDAGYRFTRDGASFPFRGCGAIVPTIEEALALAPDVRLNLEMKTYGEALPRALHQLVSAHGIHDRVLVASAHGPTVRAFRRLARGRVATSAGFDEVLRFWLAARARAERFLPIDYDALQVPERWRGLRVVDARTVDAAHRRGLHVHVWTVDDPAGMARLRGLGVDGIMTDRPDLLVPGSRVTTP